MFQSTLPRGERLAYCYWWRCTRSVSIHAPTWGATSKGSSKLKVRGVSIHAPTWGATGRLDRKGLVQLVSIHAPTWGATKMAQPSLLSLFCFNPRSHVGSDLQLPTECLMWRGFNPRSHVGSDASPLPCSVLN